MRAIIDEHPTPGRAMGTEQTRRPGRIVLFADRGVYTTAWEQVPDNGSGLYFAHTFDSEADAREDFLRRIRRGT